MAQRAFPKHLRAAAKALLRREVEAAGLDVGAAAKRFGITEATLREYLRPGDGAPAPSRSLWADMAYALGSAEMLTLMVAPHGYAVVRAEELERLRAAAAEAEELRTALRVAMRLTGGGT